MTPIQRKDSAAMDLNDDDILAYLKANPKFLKNNPEALGYMDLPPISSEKGVADFQSYMIKRLKADKEQVMHATQVLVENSRANMNNQQRIHKAVLRLLEARNFDDFIRTITLDLATMLDVDIATFVVEAGGADIPHVHTSGIRVLPAGTIDNWMQDKNILLQDHISGIEPIYGGGAALVQSQALLRIDISMDTPPAILAFGARDPNMFHAGQATDQALFLARVIERSFRHWLDLPV